MHDSRFQNEIGPDEPVTIPECTQLPPRVIVTICGSMRFYRRMLATAAELTTQGVIVLMPHAVVPPDQQDTEAKKRLDALHLDKIDMADRVVVVTDHTRYIGESTRAEISHALRWNRPVTLCMRPPATSPALDTAPPGSGGDQGE